MSNTSTQGQAHITPVSLSFVESHSLSTTEALTQYSSSVSTGLTSQEVARRLASFGRNELQEQPGETILQKIIEQITEPMVELLLGAAVLSFLISLFSHGDKEDLPSWVEPAVIFVIVVVNTLIGIYQDYNAERSMESLKRLQAKSCEVLRDGSFSYIDSALLVPGDIVRLKVGEIVPADCRVIKLMTPDFKVNESIFTGEPFPVSKETEPVRANADMADRKCMVYSASTVEFGTIVALVVKTGNSTMLGSIKTLVEEAKEDIKDDLTPLRKQLANFGSTLSYIISIICVLIWLISIPKFFDEVHNGVVRAALYYFKQAVALGVAAIPEGLPAVITTCLALGTRRMVAKNALVRKLSKVETLGCTTVICSDKTGTLTRNEMFASTLLLLDGDAKAVRWSVSGVGYSTDGEFKAVGHRHSLDGSAPLRFAEACLLGSEATIVDGKPRGIVTECALIALSRKLVKARADFDENKYEKMCQLPFTGFRKVGSCIINDIQAKSLRLVTKGAAEIVIKSSDFYLDLQGNVHPMTEAQREELLKMCLLEASQGYRMLGVAYRDESNLPALNQLEVDEEKRNHLYKSFIELPNEERLEQKMIFVGATAISDPVRAEVPAAVQRCREAGIVVVMITGDQKETAESIGRQLGFGNSAKTFVGKDLDEMTPLKLAEELRQSVRNKTPLIFARTNPTHKRMIVKALTDAEEIVAMTGDGSNDAPALKQASIGIAMGVAGTDVAKEASDIILLDDNFNSIVNAIEEGRTIYANMKAFIKYMISSNIGEVVSIFLTSFLGIPEGFNSIQLLWVNLVTDGVPATALSFNPPEADIMTKNPRKKSEALLNRNTLIRFLIIGSYVGFATVGIFIYYYTSYSWAGDNHQLVSYWKLSHWTKCKEWESQGVVNACDEFIRNKAKASTLSLTVLVIIEMFNSLNALSENLSLFTVGMFANIWLVRAIFLSTFLHCLILYIPFFNNVFSVVPLTFRDWILVLLFSLPVVLIEEVLKYLNRSQAKAQSLLHKKTE